jgi:hypothetical protein
VDPDELAQAVAAADVLEDRYARATRELGSLVIRQRSGETPWLVDGRGIALEERLRAKRERIAEELHSVRLKARRLERLRDAPRVVPDPAPVESAVAALIQRILGQIPEARPMRRMPEERATQELATADMDRSGPRAA